MPPEVSWFFTESLVLGRAEGVSFNAAGFLEGELRGVLLAAAFVTEASGALRDSKTFARVVLGDCRSVDRLGLLPLEGVPGRLFPGDGTGGLGTLLVSVLLGVDADVAAFVLRRDLVSLGLDVRLDGDEVAWLSSEALLLLSLSCC